jgi:hypothetical protein
MKRIKGRREKVLKSEGIILEKPCERRGRVCDARGELCQQKKNSSTPGAPFFWLGRTGDRGCR